MVALCLAISLHNMAVSYSHMIATCNFPCWLPTKSVGKMAGSCTPLEMSRLSSFFQLSFFIVNQLMIQMKSRGLEGSGEGDRGGGITNVPHHTLTCCHPKTLPGIKLVAVGKWLGLVLTSAQGFQGLSVLHEELPDTCQPSMQLGLGRTGGKPPSLPLGPSGLGFMPPPPTLCPQDAWGSACLKPFCFPPPKCSLDSSELSWELIRFAPKRGFLFCGIWAAS